MKLKIILLIILTLFFMNCEKNNIDDNSSIKGYNLLTEVAGHWVGKNETPFGDFDWFAFDFRPISASHVHSIYEGGTNSNIISSFFVADFQGQKQIMGRNGGWLGNQYRATYFVLDKAEETANRKYYRLVDAAGGVKRSYMELFFTGDTFQFAAYKDNSGTLDEPVIHMSFEGTNYNPDFATAPTTAFNFPQEVAEVDLNNKFNNLLDPDSVLFLEENQDPFPKSQHGHLSDLTINIERAEAVQDKALLFYLSTEPIINADRTVNFDNLDRKVVRTINVTSAEAAYTTTYLHPDSYYITMFSDLDGNFFPSNGDYTSASTPFEVLPESDLSTNIKVDLRVTE